MESISGMYTRRSTNQPAGITLLEVMVVMFILLLISSLIFPALDKARRESKKVQCANNMKQLSYALAMYQQFEGRDQNAYPERLTHMADPAHLYVSDPRIFICPMDQSKGTSVGLKPGKPVDNKSDWTERVNSAPAWPGDTRPQLNLSYLYEFSTRVCQYYTRSTNTFDSDGWITQFLVEWYSDTTQDPPIPTPCNDDALAYDINGNVAPKPSDMSLFGLVVRDKFGNPTDTGIITWQEAKFWQKINGDVCNTGLAYPGDNGSYPSSWFTIYDISGNQLDPWDMIFYGYDLGDGSTTTSSVQHGYPGGWLPIVRCFWHQTPQWVDNESFEEVLNLAVEGNTFYSAPGWEQSAWNHGRDGDIPQGP